MSYTEIIIFKKNKDYECMEFPNGGRSALAIWKFIEKKYGITYDYFNRDRYDKELGIVFHNKKSDLIDRICLGISFGRTLVKRENFKSLCNEMYNFKEKSSLKEQADFIRKFINDENVLAVGWNHTSVDKNFWLNWYDNNLEKETLYDINNGKEHYWLFEELNKEKK